ASPTVGSDDAMNAGCASVWDTLTLTAAHAAQAKGYRLQLKARAERLREMFDAARVVADPGGRRVGSGGSTILVLMGLVAEAVKAVPGLRTLEACFQSKRHLIVHSGGDARRLPAFAALGKVFVPLPAADEFGHPLSMFELLTDDLASVTLGARGGVLVASGDVFLGLAGAMLGSRLKLDGVGLTGVAFAGTAATASRHGVYVVKNGGVVDFLQKPDARALHARDALAEDGSALIDSGVVALSPKAAAGVLHAAGVRVSKGVMRVEAGSLAAQLKGTRPPNVDLYQHVLMAPVERVTETDYLALPGVTSDSERAFRAFRNGVRRIATDVRVMESCPFVHIGTTREWLALAKRQAPEWLVRAGGVAFGEPQAGGHGPEWGASHGWNLGVDSLVTVLPAAVSRPFELPRGIGLCMLPIDEESWTAIVFGDDDDSKTTLAKGGTILNQGFKSELVQHLVGRGCWKSIEEAGAATLWDAPLFAVGTAKLVLRTALDRIEGGGPGHGLCLAELVSRINHARLISMRNDAWRSMLARRPLEALRTFRHLDLGLLDAARGPKGAMRIPENEAGRVRVRAAAMEGAAVFAEVARSIAGDEGALQRIEAKVGTSVTASCPARIDLAGGWTDTPPICQELGGEVINLAARIGVQERSAAVRPLTARAVALDEAVIVLESRDLGKKAHLTSARALEEAIRADDWRRLPLAVLRTVGIVPRNAGDVANWWKTFERGVHVTLHSALPAGSGLGASSILGAAAIAAVSGLLDRSGASGETDRWGVIAKTLELEQLMTTGGGWQDQVGGVIGGVKRVSSEAGEQQRPTVVQLSSRVFESEEARARCVLFFTGRRRLARNILRGVVGSYVRGDRGVVATAHALRDSVPEMQRAIEAGDLEGVASGVTRYWELKKQMDPGSTNAFIEGVIEAVRPDASGWTLTGAGGGGFLFVIAKSAAAGKRLRRVLSRGVHAASMLVPFEVDGAGLVVERDG
ncbi:MAG: L-fucokinase, partial [bacterium]|nr:L-fucokinase [bacterium]